MRLQICESWLACSYRPLGFALHRKAVQHFMICTLGDESSMLPAEASERLALRRIFRFGMRGCWQSPLVSGLSMGRDSACLRSSGS